MGTRANRERREIVAVEAYRTIALAIREAGGRALIVGGWVRDRLLGRDSKDVDIEVFGVAPDTLRTILESPRARRHCRRKLPGVQDRRHRRVASPPRIEDPAAATRASTFPAIRTCRLQTQPAGATSPSTPSPGIRSPTNTSTRSTAAATLPRALLRVVDPADVRRRQPACAARRFNLPLASDSRSMPATFELCRTIPLDDLPAERVWGEVEKLLFAPRAVDRTGARPRPRRRRTAVSGAATPSSAARRSRSGIPRATCGCTRCRWSTRCVRASTTSRGRSKSR